MKKALFTLALLALTARCYAAPILTAIPTNLGGGLTAFDVSVVDPSDPAGSYQIQLTFTGPINKETLKVGKATINPTDDATALTWDGTGTYLAVADTWAYTSAFSLLTGFFYIPSYTATSFTISEGTGGGNPLTDFQLAHVTVQDTKVSYSGTISHNGQDFPVSGVLAVPEPATWLLLGLGAVAVVVPWYRRRATS